MRVTKGKRGKRRLHHKASVAAMTDEQGTARRRHYASRLTGEFKGRKVLDMTRSDLRKQKREEAKQGSAEEKRNEIKVEEPAVMKENQDKN